jgi:hypothetical protein
MLIKIYIISKEHNIKLLYIIIKFYINKKLKIKITRMLMFLIIKLNQLIISFETTICRHQLRSHLLAI